jgi:DNA-binding NarL/FixJ family response regulator
MIAPGVTRRLIEDFVGRPRSGLKSRDIEGITEREREVLTLIARGLSNGEIADSLCISMATAKTHVARLLTKLGARDRVQLVITAYEAGLVWPSR